jgi:ribosomal protein S4E
MKKETMEEVLKDGDFCQVTAGTHKGKSGIVRDLNVSKTGHLTITVVQENGVRFKTLGKNVRVHSKKD